MYTYGIRCTEQENGKETETEGETNNTPGIIHIKQNLNLNISIRIGIGIGIEAAVTERRRRSMGINSRVYSIYGKFSYTLLTHQRRYFVGNITNVWCIIQCASVHNPQSVCSAMSLPQSQLSQLPYRVSLFCVRFVFSPMTMLLLWQLQLFSSLS